MAEINWQTQFLFTYNRLKKLQELYPSPHLSGVLDEMEMVLQHPEWAKEQGRLYEEYLKKQREDLVKSVIKKETGK